MNFFQVIASLRDPRAPHRRRGGRAFPRVESLEDRFQPCCVTISGFVYHDANYNGLYDPGEPPIANNPIELRDAHNKVVADTVTDANGFYSFSTDPRINTNPATKEYDVSFPDKPTDWTDTRSLPQFNPSLGTLTSVEIHTTDPLTNDIKVENLDSAPATIHASVTGSATLSGPSVPSLVTQLNADHTFSASAFDGVIDFGGTSGHDFGPQTVPGTNAVALTAPADLAPYIGTGSVAFTDTTHASSTATGSANLLLSVSTDASAQVQVIYHYIPSNCLAPGAYTIIQQQTPPGFIPGLKTSGNVTPIPNSVTTNAIHVTAGTGGSSNNNFGELKPSSLSGYVYLDYNDNGVNDPGEPGLAGMPITLTGVDDLGNAVTLTQTTGADGGYHFTNLRPGTYQISEFGNDGYYTGKDAAGSTGGTVSPDQIAGIHLPQGTAGVNNNFAELAVASLAGFVYFDGDNNGIREPGEPGIPGVLVTLTGTDDQGTPVAIAQQTAADGSYDFGNLRPGVYTITRTQPNGFIPGRDTIGTLGGITSPGQFSDINLMMGVNGLNNDFAELLPAAQAVPQAPPPAPPPAPPAAPTVVGKQFFLASSALRGLTGG
jgi:SdrD B-like domain